MLHYFRKKRISQIIEQLFDKDPYWDRVVLSLHGSATDTSDETFVDSSSNALTVTGNGGLAQGYIGPFVGFGSFAFDGVNDYLTVANHSTLDLGNSDFTIECWFKINSFTAGTYQVIAAKSYNDAVGQGPFCLQLYGNSLRFYAASAGAPPSTWNLINGAIIGAVTPDTWTHVAVCRIGSTVYMYLNGTLMETSLVASSALYQTTYPLTLGTVQYSGGFTSYLNGKISNFRIVKGSSVYTSAFTPPTLKLPVVAGTSVLLRADYGVALNNHTFFDTSATNAVITRQGNVSQGSFGPFAGQGGSAYFDGSGDYLETASLTTNINFGTNDYTVECWINIVGDSSPDPNNTKSFIIISASGGTGDFNILGNSSISGVSLEVYAGPGKSVIVNNSFTKGVWYHIAYVRRSGILTFYVNGSSVGSGSQNYQVGADGSTIRVGGRSGATWNRYFNGYISNLRVVKGTALYTSNFTVPTAPLTTVANTSLLLKFENAGITDFTRNNVLETVGNSTVTTAQKKFGNTAIYFDGNGDYLQGNTTALNFGTGDFTVEGWIYPSSISSPQYQCIVGGASGEMFIGLNNTTVELGKWQVAGVAGSNGVLQSNKWQHFAVVRSNGITRIYIDGVGGTSYTDTNSYSFASSFRIGATSSATNYAYFNGYIDDLRVTKYARYQTNFTPRQNNQYADAGPSFDPYWDKVVLRMTMDGANNGTVFTDAKGKTISRTGAVTSTTVKKFGTASAYFPAAGWKTNILSATSPDFNFGTNDLTIELWYQPESKGNTYPIVLANYNTYGTGAGIIGINDRHILNTTKFTVVLNGAATAAITSLTTPVNGTWYHLALTRNGNLWSFFVNGILEGTAVVDFTARADSVLNLGNTLDFAGSGGAQVGINGYIDDVRITNGVARYIKNFAVPASTLPVSDYVWISGDKYDPYWSQTVLAMPLDTLVDTKANVITNINSGVTSISSEQSLFGLGTSLKNGSGGGLITTIPAIGTSDFTAECWFYATSLDATYAGSIFDTRTDTSNAVGGFLLSVKTDFVSFNYSDGNTLIAVISESLAVSLNEWHHIAVTRVNGIVRLFLDGAMIGTPTANSTNFTLTNLKIGANAFRNVSGATSLIGYLQDARITKGKARYTTSFAVPTVANPTCSVAF